MCFSLQVFFRLVALRACVCRGELVFLSDTWRILLVKYVWFCIFENQNQCTTYP